jgi:hypothetical protein
VNRSTQSIPGYDYGAATVPRSPVTVEDFSKLEQSADFTAEDRRYLSLAGEVLAEQAEKIVDAWRSRIGAQEHLVKWFFSPDGKPDDHYKAAVKPRFVKWVIDVCTAHTTRPGWTTRRRSDAATRLRKRTSLMPPRRHPWSHFAMCCHSPRLSSPRAGSFSRREVTHLSKSRACTLRGQRQ